MKQRSNDRSAACPVCGKTFARSDTLLRHEKSHHASEDRGPLHRVTSGTFRACKACASARSRCSGGQPCGRCNVRKIDCVYPNKRRKATDASEQGEFSDQLRNTQASAPGFGEFVFSINTPAVPDASATHSQQFSLDRSYSGQRTSGAHVFTSILNTDSTTPSEPFTTNAHTVAYQNYQQPSPGFDYSNFEDAINWIPLSVYPSPYDAELEQDFSFLPPLPHGHNLAADFASISTLGPTPSTYDNLSPTYQSPYLTQPGQPIGNTQITALTSPASSTSDSTRQHDSAVQSTRTGPLLGEVKRKRQRSSVAPDVFMRSRSERQTFAFPHIIEGQGDTSLVGRHRHHCSQHTYDTIRSVFRQLCLDSVMIPSFETSTFPSYGTVNNCIELYFEEFAAGFPIIHVASFGQQTKWILMLATAAIGSVFVTEGYAVELRDAFQEFLRRAINQYTDAVSDFGQDMDLGRARILNLIGLAQSERDQLRLLVPRYHAELSRWLLESGILQLSHPAGQSIAVNQADISTSWTEWVKVESIRRVGYMTWLLDCSSGYMANSRPLCNIDDARSPLPAVSSLWNATSASSWAEEAHDATVPPSLCTALENLYGQKRADSTLGEWSHILLIHALYQRTWEVGTHIKQPLSEWVPTGKAQGFLNTPSKDSFWLPLYPLYANWRNSACDCLDFLHWHAMETIAKRSGSEPAVVLQLHLARIVLLTPFQELQDLLFSLLGSVGDASKASYYVHDGSYQPRNNAKIPQIRKITWRWLREDQHKARLAVIHSGSVFWHVRRYSSRSFHEPIAVYLASIVLWVYGTYKTAALDRALMTADGKRVGGPSGPDADAVVQPSRVERRISRRSVEIEEDMSMMGREPEQRDREMNKTDSHQEVTDSEDGSRSEEEPEFIHLDRPCDDDIVQHFIRNGHQMNGYMSNIGDICQSPGKILQEGAKLLRTKLGCWGVSREYHEVLIRLSELRKVT